MHPNYQPPNTARNKHNSWLNKSLLNQCCLLLVTVSISACSVSSQMNSVVEENTLVTGSVTKPVEPEGVESTDAEVIKDIVAESSSAESKTSELAWNNPDTGNSGTIVAIGKFVGSHGQKCKKFQTTIDSFVGISLYDGETCEVKRGLWVLSWFMRR
jgi:surface antigen